MSSRANVGALLLVVVAAGCGARTSLEEGPGGIDAGPRVDSGPFDDAAARDCFEVPMEGGAIEIDIELTVRDIDLALVVETTGSTLREVSELQHAYGTTVVPYLVSRFDSARVSMFAFSDFSPYGAGGDQGVRRLVAAHPASDTERWVGDFTPEDGGDAPEAQTVALRRITAGDNPECAPAEVGQACFGDRGLRVTVLLTDSPFHDGPAGYAPYEAAHVMDAEPFDAVMRRVESARVRVAGVVSPGELARLHVEATALRTGAVVDGVPIVAEVPPDGVGVADAVVSVIAQVVDRVPLSVQFLPTEGAEQISSIRAVADPTADLAGDRIEGVEPGTRVRLRVQLSSGFDAAPSHFQIAAIEGETTVIATVGFCVRRRR